jgi:hypothetical protein
LFPGGFGVAVASPAKARHETIAMETMTATLVPRRTATE